MVVYNVFSSCVCYHYKAYLCSKASAVLIILSVLTVLFPIIFTYRSHGFWLRTDTYQEQPKVNFKYDYVIFFDMSKGGSKKMYQEEKIVLCSNIPKITILSNHYNYCPFIKAYEEDLNGDGINDMLDFETKMFVPFGNTVTGMTVLLFFDYKLSSYCRAEFEAMAYVQHLSTIPGAGVEIIGDLTLIQKQPLNPRFINTQYNTSTVTRELDSKPFDLRDVLLEYSLRNVSTKMTNVYKTWITRRMDTEPFIVHVNVIYSEATVKYKPTTWQILRTGWAQFFPVFFISVLMFGAIKSFIFSNQLVTTYREDPWTKDH